MFQTAVDDFGLRPMTSGFYSGYEIDLNPSVANSVATAALWFTASLMPRNMAEYDKVRTRCSARNNFQQPTRPLPPGTSSLVEKPITEVSVMYMRVMLAGGDSIMT